MLPSFQTPLPFFFSFLVLIDLQLPSLVPKVTQEAQLPALDQRFKRYRPSILVEPACIASLDEVFNFNICLPDLSTRLLHVILGFNFATAKWQRNTLSLDVLFRANGQARKSNA